MKFTKSLFGKEENDIEKFNQLDLDERSIVFYSEGPSYYVYFEQIIKELIENHGKKICYITSSKDDPILKNKNEKIKTFYIGNNEITKLKFFYALKARVLIMTMPDLGRFHIKRSKVFPVHYIYVFHSMKSAYTGLRKDAFDDFDTIFCAGEYHIQEIRAIEKMYNLKQKNLVACGYGLLDKLLEDISSLKQPSYLSKNGKKKILIAPTSKIGKTTLLESIGLELVKILLDANYHVTIRPHPMTIQEWPKIIQKIKDEFEKNPDFLLETQASSFDELFSSYGLITDWSGIGYEYAFVCERPVIYFDVPQKTYNKEYEKMNIVPFEISIRGKIGEIISNQNLEKLPEKIELLYEQINNFKDKIQKIRNNTISNIGKSGQIAANEIIRILNEEKK
jgi:YidC/Oxa1 family membrane protein insertase